MFVLQLTDVASKPFFYCHIASHLPEDDEKDVIAQNHFISGGTKSSQQISWLYPLSSITKLYMTAILHASIQVQINFALTSTCDFKVMYICERSVATVMILHSK